MLSFVLFLLLLTVLLNEQAYRCCQTCAHFLGRTCARCLARYNKQDDKEVKHKSISTSTSPAAAVQCNLHSSSSQKTDAASELSEEDELTLKTKECHGTRPNRSDRYLKGATERTKCRIAARQNWLCAICFSLLDETYKIDQSEEYLQALCRSCHKSKTTNVENTQHWQRKRWDRHNHHHYK